MRILSLVLLATLTASPAMAGTLSYPSGSSAIVWTSTQCKKPVPPSAVTHNPEAAAADLNQRLIEHNSFAQAVTDYMKCLSDESQRDTAAIAQTIQRTVDQEIRSQQDLVGTSADRLSAERSKVSPQ